MSSTVDNICKTISEVNNNDDVCVVNDMLQNMSTADKGDINVSVCANCGKEGDDINTFATNVRLQLIAMLYVRRYTKRSIGKSVRNICQTCN